MDILYYTRPFNVRYVVRDRNERYTPELLRTHRTAKANWLYIHRQHGIDELGPVPDWSARNDLVDYGRCAPSRANDPVLDGVALWERADRQATAIRPDEPVCAHAVGSLPAGQDRVAWRNLIEGFAEDHLISQGMVVDWAIHHRVETGDRPEILPHVHMLITTRVFDPGYAEVGRIRQNWLRTKNARKSLAEKWWARTGLYPSGYAVAA